MTLPLELVIDGDGRPRARWPWKGPATEMLPHFLETDLGEHEAYVRQILREGRRVLQGRAPRWTVSGNAYGLVVEPDLTTIQRLDPKPNSPAVQIPTRDFLLLVDRWLRLIDQDETA